MATTLYRATSETETGIPGRSCWSEDYEVAAAYSDNPGFGGEHIRSIEIDLNDEDVLDITGPRGMAELAETLGLAGEGQTADEVAEQWRADYGWIYPWEESSAIRAALEESGYSWLRYDDDYPEGAVTMMRI